MNTNRKNFIQGVLTGILLCLLGAGAYFFGPSLIPQKAPKAELSFDDALTRLQSKDVKEALVRADTLELTEKDGDRYIVRLDSSDATRTAILAAAKESDAVIKLEPASTGYGWIVLIQFLPLGLLFIATMCLVVIAYTALFNKRVDKNRTSD